MWSIATSPDLAAIVGAAAATRRLAPRADVAEPGWMFWELRTLNMHRVVGLLAGSREFGDAQQLEMETRGAISRIEVARAGVQSRRRNGGDVPRR